MQSSVTLKSWRSSRVHSDGNSGEISELAWLEMRGMRNLMAHEYFVVSPPIIWRAIEFDLIPLADGLTKLLAG
jgi:uncharacterized protein with HEPN domain